ncbi:methionine--tRNA ligase [Candidatus Woesearchaeota archaeon]|nr:methionine--tRNA ligase [Candidatus Woesearchaeota archaeon]
MAATKPPSIVKPRDNIVITAALPYANGPIHIGHLLEYIQADIYSRFLKLTGKNALYICASDMHGTPIEVNARKVGKEPEKFALEFWKEHQVDFSNYLIKFDNYYQTHSSENKELAEYFYHTLKQKKLIYRKKVQVIYCPHCQRYLPDRYVKGTCPHCGAQDQYGDICEKCNKALKGTNLISPSCSLCGNQPIQKESEHYFFRLSTFSAPLKAWFNNPDSGIQPEVRNWLKEWINKGLEDWCVSRDAPYFGFEIPDSKRETGEKKYFYVWLDAPIGYISSTQNYCAAHKLKWEDYWRKGQVYHFIGKDIAYFHFLFWPAMLMAVEIPLPKLTVHGFITVNGGKMSKSRGTFFTAKDFLKLYSPEALRFYYAAHLDRKLIDVDLNFEDFKSAINTVLVGNLGNFCYRVLTFAEKNYGGVKEIAAEKGIILEMKTQIKEINKNYSEMDFKSAVKNILNLSDIGNAYFQKSEPWKSKDDKNTKAAVGLCINIARDLAVMVSPILPKFSVEVFAACGEKKEKISWKEVGFTWKGRLSPVRILVEKIEKLPLAVKFPLHMVVGKITGVKNHPHADSLYLMKVDFGTWGKRQAVAGLKKYLSPEQLLNKKAIFVINLKPAKLRGEMSEAMVLAADDKVKVVPLLAEKSAVGEEVCFGDMDNSTQEITFEEFQKLRMDVLKGRVIYQEKKLKSKVEEILIPNVKEGAQVR